MNSPTVTVGPYRQALDALVGASDMELSEALAGAFILLDAPDPSPHITLPREALVTILRGVRAAVVFQERLSGRAVPAPELDQERERLVRVALSLAGYHEGISVRSEDAGNQQLANDLRAIARILRGEHAT